MCGPKRVTLRTALLGCALALGVAASTTSHVRAQGVQGLFEQYLESLRRQAGIPGISAVIVQHGRIVWEKGFGYQDVERSIPAFANTPYPVGDLTQTLTSTLLLQCVEEGELDLDSPIREWTSTLSDGGLTVKNVLSHTTGRDFRYDPGRFLALTPVVDACLEQPYRQALAERILERLGMRDSVPGHDLDRPDGAVRDMFSGSILGRYSDVTREVATPYRVDGRRNASPSRFPSTGMDASTGLITTARDLARFDAGLDDDGLLLQRRTRDMAFSSATGSAPFGLGWFVQNYRGYKLVWHFGEWRDAYSSLILKVPERGLTLILLANSDGLTSDFPMASGDVSASLFARVFLSVYL
jgi:CubicO group peptidase (beta-lactamase class C family)